MGTSKKTVEETYKKLSQREHVLLRPGMYIGSTSKCLEEIFVCQETLDNRVVKKMTEFTPGFLKIFDEILTNATDHATRDSGTTSIKVTCNRETGEISVWNNGAGIPVKIHKDHGIYVPELIFGHLLSGSNYDDSSQRTGAGVNGLGGKLTSLFSLRFLVETIDSEVGKKFSQEYLDNMSVVKKPKVTANSGKSYTKITFLPDYKRFSMEKDLLDADTFSLLKRRVLDCIACTNVGIYFNGEKFKGRGLVDYSKFYFSSDFPGCISELYTEKVRDSEYIWEYAVVTWDQYTQVSFVNGNNTYAGGKHVEFILNQIINKTKVYLETKKKIKDVKSSVIRERLFLFLRATIANPQFNSQTKESLTTNIKDFGCKGPVVSDKFMEKLFKTGVIDEIIAISKAKESASLAKATDGKKTNKIYVPKLEDAIWAGTAKSGECTLVLTEGLSAMTFAMWGRSVIGPQKVGVFPLKGKLINIRDASVSQLMNNEELTNLKTIIGLKIGKKYTDTSELRYSRVLCLTDADLDGSHIKALLVNIFHVNWPELLKLKTPFLQTLKTPIVKATKNKKVLEFYTEQDYHKWESSVGHTNGWTIKYFKGLGTSKKEDAQDTFRRFEELRVDYFHQDKRCDESIVLAFDKDNGKKSGEVKSSDKRKNWLADYDREVYISADTNKVSFQDLIHKELIHFSIYDNLRSIPNLCDGLKPSQRKILYYLLKNNVRKSMKVAQLSGYVSAETSYHHGETSLQQAIIGMGQDFVGTNNLNLLYPDGNFGSRLLGGKDAASPRYIFTRFAFCTYIFFDKNDSKLLKYGTDDGMPIEPEWFLPVIPMVLVNGCEGIGTGYSTSVPCYNPKDIISNLKAMLEKTPVKRMTPWFKGFKGQVSDIGEGNFTTRGIWKRTSKTRVEITELPVGTWISGYKEFLETMIADRRDKEKSGKKKGLELKEVRNETKDENSGIHFIVEFKTEAELDKLIDKENLEKELKLVKPFNTNNMYLFDPELHLRKYENEIEILKKFFEVRCNLYSDRRDLIISTLVSELELLEAKSTFIREYIEGILKINRQTKVIVEAQLKTRKYPMVEGSYDYLTRLPVISMTEEKINELQKSCEKKRSELARVKKMTAKTMWSADLEQISF